MIDRLVVESHGGDIFIEGLQEADMMEGHRTELRLDAAEAEALALAILDLRRMA